MTREFRGVSVMMPLTPRVIVGMLVVGFGAALLLDNLGIMEAGDLIRFWPFGLIAIGLAKLLQDQDRSGRIAGGMFAGIGTLIAIDNFLFVRLDFWRWWPLAVVGFGVLILARAFRSNEENRQGLGYGSPGGSTAVGGGLSAGEGRRHDGAVALRVRDVVRPAAARGVARVQARRTHRHHGRHRVRPAPGRHRKGEAVIDVFVMWGGIEITVPPDWAVSNQITPILGGSEDKSTGTQQARNRLIVKGVVIMGGVDIKT